MIVDCNVTLGHWPFRRLSHSSPAAFVELMDTAGITQAWVSPFEAIFYNVVQDANDDLAGQLCGLQDRLVQLPVLNPAYPGWEDDVAECLNWSVPGFRVYPGYHGYSLGDGCFGEMLEAIAPSHRFVQIVTRVQDERHQHHLARVAPVDLAPLSDLARRFRDTAFIVLNAATAELLPLLPKDGPANLYCDISHVEGIGGVSELAEQVGAEHILFGTHAPLLYPESALLKMREADLTPQDAEQILHGNAARLVSVAW